MVKYLTLFQWENLQLFCMGSLFLIHLNRRAGACFFLVLFSLKTFGTKNSLIFPPFSFQMYITSTIKTKSSRLAKPVLCLGTLCSAFLTGLNRVSEYRNHCSDVVAGFILGSAIALFLVRTTKTCIRFGKVVEKGSEKKREKRRWILVMSYFQIIIFILSFILEQTQTGNWMINSSCSFPEPLTWVCFHFKVNHVKIYALKFLYTANIFMYIFDEIHFSDSTSVGEGTKYIKR